MFVVVLHFPIFTIFISQWPTFIPDNIFPRIFFILCKDSRKQAQESSFTHMQTFGDDCAPSQLHFWRINKKISFFLLPGGEQEIKVKNRFCFLQFHWRWKFTRISLFIFLLLFFNDFSVFKIFLTNFVAEKSVNCCHMRKKNVRTNNLHRWKVIYRQFCADFVLESLQLVAVKCTLAAFLLMRGNIFSIETKWSVISHENWGVNIWGRRMITEIHHKNVTNFLAKAPISHVNLETLTLHCMWCNKNVQLNFSGQ